MRATKIALMASMVAACSPGFEDEDAGIPDGRADAAADAGVDAGADPGQDPGDDVGISDGDDQDMVPDGDDGLVDAADDGGVDDGDAGLSDGDQRPDYDPQGSFLIIVPENVSLCSTFSEARTWQQELSMLARIDLQPGYYVLPRQTGSVPAVFVSMVLFGPDQAEPSPLGAEAEFIATYYDWSWGAETWEYTFVQEYVWEGQPFVVEVFFSFYSNNEQWPAEQLADNDFSMTGTIKIGPGQDWITERQVLSNCPAPPMMTVDLETHSGDQLTLDKGLCWSCMCAGNTSCYFFRNAQVNLGSYSSLIDEHFSLVYSAGHHNDGEMFLIKLDPPAGEVGALLVQAPPMASTEGGVLRYLDGGLNELRSEDIVQWVNNW